MVFEELKENLGKFLQTILNFLITTVLGRITLIISVLLFLNTIGLLSVIGKWITTNFSFLYNFLKGNYYGIPIYYWVILCTVLVVLLLFSIWQYLYLKLVSGVFHDNFKNGLSKWEFGGEGWRTEHEENKIILSISESPDGGITKKGFTWSDYEFSFETKVINKNIGWIVRAENRNKYLMIQLNMENPTSPKLRLHLRIPPSERNYQWIVMQENEVSLDKPLKLLQWMTVRIVVLGSNIDVYINKSHSAHYFIADPLRWQDDFRKQVGEKQEKPDSTEAQTYITAINYSAGKVGFRCFGDEHVHVRKVEVKPLLE